MRAKLPKSELKKFNGRAYEWQEFWDSFRSSVRENEELAQVDKFTFLRHLMEERAKTVIAGSALTEENYESAVELLQQRFAIA